MNDEIVLEWLRSRRSIRKYEDRPVPPELIQRVLEAAMWAPSAHNRQPWRFVVLTGKREKNQLAQGMAGRLREDLLADGQPPDQIEADAGRSIRRLEASPVIIVVTLSIEEMDHYPDEKRRQKEWLMAVQSTAMAGQNLLLSAHAMGLGACWMCAPLFCPSTVKDILQLPAAWQPQGLVTLGYPAEHKTKSRRPLNSVVISR